MLNKFKMWWLFHVRNGVVRKGEKGGFKWVFRRFWMEISTLSGNFKARFTAAEYPYGYLLAGKSDTNIEGFSQMLYMVGMLMTTDQGFADDIQRAILKYEKRLVKTNPVVEDEKEEKMALESEKEVQEHLDLPENERKNVVKDIDKRFKASLKKVKSGGLREESPVGDKSDS